METVYRILMINTEDGFWQNIRGEEPKHEKISREALIEYAEENVFVKDKARFISFLYRHYGKVPEGVEKIFYRRNCGPGRLEVLLPGIVFSWRADCAFGCKGR